eukprot:6194443-Pleurochrysis_carterae.AAC.1
MGVTIWPAGIAPHDGLREWARVRSHSGVACARTCAMISADAMNNQVRLAKRVSGSLARRLAPSIA